VKKVAKELVKRYPDKFSTDFESNKKLLGSVSKISSVRLRNRIAGYITRLVAIAKAAEKAEAEETAEAVEEAE
jgi:small subunit ribosomal protein S17e